MGILTNSGYMSMTSVGELKNTKPGDLLNFDEVNMFGKPARYYKLKVVKRNFSLTQLVLVIGAKILSIIANNKVISVIPCVITSDSNNESNNKNAVIITAVNKQEDMFMHSLDLV